MSAQGSLLDELEARVAQRRRERLESYPDNALVYLAVVPYWTAELASRCGFPTGEDGLPKFLERLAAEGLVEQRPGEPGQERFWMSGSIRAEIEAIHSKRELKKAAVEVADKIQSARSKGAEVAPVLACWVSLALAQDPASLLLREVNSRTAADDAPAALEWLRGGEALVIALGAQLASAVELGRRRVNLLYRRRQDERYLQRFLKRDEQLRPVRELLEPSSEQWALHFVGMGGVGKTMLLRHISSEFAAERGIQAARVDFDHLDPNYPTESPGELLIELADALSIYAEDKRYEGPLSSFREAISRVHQIERPAGDHPLAAVRSDAFRQALDYFAAFVRTVAPRPLFILDTCEELAKLYPPGERVWGVEAMFEILDALHEDHRIPGLRVLFAGRRALGAPPEDDQQERAPTDVSPPEFMRVERMVGFDADDAERYLRGRPKVPARLIPAVLQRAADDEGAVPRYNPFSLALYADWLEQGKEHEIEQFLAELADPYVEARILQRVSDTELLKVLPAATLLGRFDAATIAPALPEDRQTRLQVLRALAEQEWVETIVGRDGDTVFEIQPALLRRLREYYRKPENSQAAVEASVRLRPALWKLLQTGLPDSLSKEQIDAALRVLPTDEATACWEVLALRIADGAHWGWATNVCALLLAPERDESLPPPVKAAVRAMLAGAARHSDPNFGSAAQWAEVEREAGDDAVGKRLCLRARLARIGQDSVGSAAVDALQQALEPLLDADRMQAEQLAAAVVAALERVVESGVQEPRLESFAEQLCRRLSAAELSADLVAFASALHARLVAATDRPLEASKLLAARGSLRSETRTRQRWTDWIAPDSIPLRIGLESLRMQLATGAVDPAQLEYWGGAAKGYLPLVDGDRIASFVLYQRLAEAPQPAERLAELGAALGGAPVPRGHTAAHDIAPPLVVMVSRGWLALGRADEALSLLEGHLDSATAKRTDSYTAFFAELALIEVLRRMRFAGERDSLIAQLAGGDQPQAGAAWAADALLNARSAPAIPPAAATAHAWWRAVTPAAISLEATRALERALNETEPRDLHAGHLALDLYEAGELGLPAPAARVAPSPDRTSARTPPGTLAEHRESLTRLALRTFALTENVAQPAGFLGARRNAELALEEGELLALRLPGAACRLLEHAERVFAGASDRVGMVIAATALASASARAGNEESAERALQRVEALGDVVGTDARHWQGWRERIEALQRWRDGVVLADASRGPALAPELDLPDRQAANRVRAFRRVAGHVRAAAVSTGALCLPFFVLQALTDLGGIGLELLAYLGVLVAMAAVLVAGRWWMSAVSEAAVVDVQVVLAATTSPSESPCADIVVGPVRIEGLRQLPIIRWLEARSRRTVQISLPTDPLSEPLPKQLRDWAPRSRGRFGIGLHAALQVPDDLQAYPWEARLLSTAIRDLDGLIPNRVVIWRIPPARGVPSAPRDRGRWTSGVVAAYCAREWLLLVEDAWQGSRLVPRWPASPGREHGGDEAAVVHLIGTPVLTNTGWRLRVDDELGATAKSSVGWTEDQTLLAPDRLPLAGVELVIVQCAPAGAVIERDRLKSESARQLSADVMRAGARAVIVVPQLPERVAADVARCIALGVQQLRRPPQLHALRRLSRKLRDIVEQAPEAPRDRFECAEVALDVCLYAPDRERERSRNPRSK